MAQEIKTYTKEEAIQRALNYAPSMKNESEEDIEQWALAGMVKTQQGFMDYQDYLAYTRTKGDQ